MWATNFCQSSASNFSCPCKQRKKNFKWAAPSQSTYEECCVGSVAQLLPVMLAFAGAGFVINLVVSGPILSLLRKCFLSLAFLTSRVESANNDRVIILPVSLAQALWILRGIVFQSHFEI